MAAALVCRAVRPTLRAAPVSAASAARCAAPCRRFAVAAADPQSEKGTGGGLSQTANSFISLGKFEPMGADVGRAATGIAYMLEAIKVQEEAYNNEADVRARSRKGLSLAQNCLQVGRQHHQQDDASTAVEFYTRAQGLLEQFIDLHLPAVESAAEEGKASALRSAATEQLNAGSDSGPKAPSAAARVEGAAKKAIGYARFELSEVCSSLGVAYNDMGRPEEALVELQRALTLRQESVGKTHPAVAECLNNIGAIYFGRGSLEKASDFYERALEQMIEAQGGREEGTHIALTLYNIGVCRARLGHGREAGAALRRALRLAERALGTDHPQVGLIKETLQQLQQRPDPKAASEPPAAGQAEAAPAGAEGQRQTGKASE